VFTHAVNGSIRLKEIESLLIALGTEVHEREGSRIAVFMKEQKNIS